MVIDGHAHACGHYLTPQSIEQYLISHKIDIVVLSGGEPNSTKNYPYPMLSNLFKGDKLCYFFNKIICNITRLNQVASHLDSQNELVYQLAKKLPHKVINTYWVNPLDDDCWDKMLSYYPRYNFKMIKLHQCWTDFDICSEICSKIFAWTAEKSLPVFIHLISKEQVIKFVNVVNKFSDTTFIVAHMIGSDYMGDALNHQNVYFDLSAPQLYSVQILKRAIKNFGVGRLILGSDTPYGTNNIDKVILRLKQQSLSEQEISSICGNNLAQLLVVENL